MPRSFQSISQRIEKAFSSDRRLGIVGISAPVLEEFETICPFPFDEQVVHEALRKKAASEEKEGL